MDILRDLTHPRAPDAAYSPPFTAPALPHAPADAALMPPPPSPLSCGVAPSLVHRPPLAPHSPNICGPPPAVPLSTKVPATTPAPRRKGKGGSRAVSKASSTGPASAAGDTGDDETPLFLAPEYTANPAGPASSADIDFKCPQCDKTYRGKHARSIWRRHLQDKHGIPLSQQPRRTRWDTDASRPKTEEEKRARTLDSKRRWARKNRAEKTGGKGATDAAPAPSASGSVGTPASEQSSEQAGVNGAEEEGDSSYDAGSASGWSDGAHGASAPINAVPAYAIPPGNPFYGAGGASVYGRTPTKHGYAPPGMFGGGAMDPYYAGMGRAPLRAASSVPPMYAPDDPRAPLNLRDANSYASGGEADEGLPNPPHATQYHLYGPTNPYSHPYLPPHQQVAQEQAHGSAYPPHAFDEYGHPHNPALLSASAALPRRPSSNPNFGASTSSNPYDHPAGGSPIVTAGQPAPVALPYYARRHSPARVLAGSGIAAGVPVPSSSSRDAPIARPSASGASGLESPVKLRRTGANGKGKELGGASSAAAGVGGRDDAAGILLALKAGPSSPMTGGAHVQSPVSSVRDQGERRPAFGLGRGARAGLGAGAFKTETSELDLDESDDDDEAEVRAMMLRSRAAAGGVGSSSAAGALSPWRAALQNKHAPRSTPAAAGAAVSPRKRGRSESPAPNLASTSSGEGSTAAAHALLATAKKAHQFASMSSVQGHSLRGSGSGPAWNHEMSLVATPTPGNLMRIAMESSPVVRFGGGGGAAQQRDGESEADLIGGVDDDDAEVDHAFTSSSGGARRPRRGRSVSPSSQKGRRRVPGAGSSSSGAGAASSSSQPRALHHHHPVGLTSELGDFDLEHSSSSAPRQHHHHHDPLREDEVAMGAHPGSSSSASSHLITPAPAASRTTTSMAAAAAAAAVAAQAHARPAAATHPHDPFLAAPGTSASLPLHMSGAGDARALAVGADGEAVPRISSPPGGFSSFLFSSPAHPQFSKTLGLTAAPGPGVLYTGAGGETPARGGPGAGAGAGGGLGAGRAREPSQDELLALAAASHHAAKTPVMARVALEGARRAAAAHSAYGGASGGGGGSHAPSDLESTEEEEGSATTGGRDESQSPGKVTLDEDEDGDGDGDGDEDGASVDE